MENYMNPCGDLGCLLLDISVAFLWRYWLPSHCLLVSNYCILMDNLTFRPFSDVAVGLFVFFCFPEELLERFHRLLDFPPWTNISWWFQHKCRTLLPTLQSDFVIHENLLWYFFFFVVVLCLVMTFIGQLLYCLLPTLQSDLYCILFRNYLSLLTLILDLLVGHPLGGIVWSIAFLYQYSHCCCFTVCCNSPLPHNRDRTYIE